MTNETILKLNKINTQFYQTVAPEFSSSRQYSWEGWQQLIPYIEKIQEKSEKNTLLRVLDVGCGNGRFAEFLKTTFPELTFSYTGIDSDKKLLEIANQSLSKQNISFQLHQLDIVSELVSNTFLDELVEKFDLIVMFGVLHHIPSLELRTKLIQNLKHRTKKYGLVVFTAWQFMDSDRFHKKLVDPQIVNLHPSDLEENDYIIDWQRGKTAYRYCHFVDERELQSLLANVPAKVVNLFHADGHDNTMNHYCILAAL